MILELADELQIPIPSSLTLHPQALSVSIICCVVFSHRLSNRSFARTRVHLPVALHSLFNCRQLYSSSTRDNSPCFGQFSLLSGAVQQSTPQPPPSFVDITLQLTPRGVHIAKYHRRSFSSYQSLAYRHHVQGNTLARRTGCYTHCHSGRPTHHIRRRLQILLRQWHTILYQR